LSGTTLDRGSANSHVHAGDSSGIATDAIASRPPALRVAFGRVAANAAGAVTALVTGPLLARALGVDGRGALAAIVVPIVLANLVVGAGSGDVLAADVAARRSSVRDLFGPSLFVAETFALVATAAVALAAPYVVHGDHDAWVLRVLALSILVSALQTTLRAVRQGEHRYRRLSLEAWLVAGSRLAALLGLWFAGLLDVTTAAAVTVATFLLPGLVLGPIPALARGMSSSRFAGLVRSRFGKSFRALPGSAAAQLNLRLDQALLTPLAGVHDLGLYAVAVSAAEVPILVTAGIRQVVLTESAARGDAKVVARAARTTILVSLPMIVIGCVLARPVIGLLFGAPFEASANMMRILLVATGLAAPGSLLATGLIASGRPGLASLPHMAGLVATVALLPPLAIAFGAVGAAWTSLLAYLIATALAVHLFARSYGMRRRDCVAPRWQDVSALMSSARRALSRHPT
jgi:O-antigen/teichoic acid export membrane protein